MYPVDVPMTCHAWLTHAIPKVRAAMEHAWYKHGEPTTDVVRGAGNLCEEVGEVMSEALEATRKPGTVYPSGSVGRMRQMGVEDQCRKKMILELWQVAGYAILLAVQLEGQEGQVNK